MDFDYFYNREAERFNFLKVPDSASINLVPVK